MHRERQALAAEGLRTRNPVPARFRPGAVGVGPAGRGGDMTIRERDAGLVADPVEWRQPVGGEAPGLLDHRRRHVGVVVIIMSGLRRRQKPGAVMERQQHVDEGRAVGHDRDLAGDGTVPFIPRKPAALNARRLFSRTFASRFDAKSLFWLLKYGRSAYRRAAMPIVDPVARLFRGSIRSAPGILAMRASAHDAVGA